MQFQNQSSVLNLEGLPIKLFSTEPSKYYSTVLSKIQKLLSDPFLNLNTIFKRDKKRMELGGAQMVTEGYDNPTDIAWQKASMILVKNLAEEIVNDSTGVVLSSNIALAGTIILKETRKEGLIKDAFDALVKRIATEDLNSCIPKPQKIPSHKNPKLSQEELDMQIVLSNLEKLTLRSSNYFNLPNLNKEIFSTDDVLKITRLRSNSEILADSISNSTNIENLKILLGNTLSILEDFSSDIYYTFIQNYSTCNKNEKIQIELLIESVNTITTAIGSSIKNQRNLKQSMYFPLIKKVKEFYLSLKDIDIETNQNGLYKLESFYKQLEI